MYVWQMSDGFWQISLQTQSRGLLVTILKNKEAFRLYDRSYESEQNARSAERTIRGLLG